MMNATIYFELKGNHIHMRVFIGRGETRALSGTLIMTKQEFEAFREGSMLMQFLPEPKQ